MVKCDKGKIEVFGKPEIIFAETEALVGQIAEYVSSYEDDGLKKLFRDNIIEAVDYGYAGTLDDDEDDEPGDDIDELLDNLFEALVKARK